MNTNKLWGLATAIQVAWGIGIVLWNGYGMYQLKLGEPTPGPTASWGVAAVGAIIAIVFGFKWLVRYKWLYIATCLICALLAFLPVAGAFTQDPGLWPSAAWRWGGVVLNGAGFLACICGVVLMFKKGNFQ